MQVAMIAPVDAHADGDALTEVALRDAVEAAITEDAVAYALALLVSGLNLVNALGTGLVTLGLLALVVAALFGGLLLLFALLAFGILLLLALLTFGTLGLLALLPGGALALLALIFLYALLIALAAFGAFHILLALPLDALRTLDGTSLDRPAFRRALNPRLAALDARRRLLWSGPLGRCCAWGIGCAISTRTPVTVLRLRKTRAQCSAQQDHRSGPCDPFRTHLIHSVLGCGAIFRALHVSLTQRER